VTKKRWDHRLMPRRTLIIGGALAVGAVGVGVAASQHRRGRGAPALVTGTFPSGMGYVRLGVGTKSLLWIPDPSHNGDLAQSGGPGIGAPRSMYLTTMSRVFRPFVEDGYSVFLVGHKPNLPHGCTVADLADDYAGLIVDEFGGKADVVVADSNGGLIGFCLAARHSDLFGHIAFVAAGYTMAETAKAANLESARLLSVGRKTDAAAVMVTLLNPGLRAAWVTRIVASVVARVSFPAVYDPGDVLVAAEAVDAFDGREILPTITVPVLLVCGDRDRFVPKAVYELTAATIPNCTLTFYDGRGHLGAMSDKRFPGDVLDFARP
jgi:pimeloyl-ACP methyl ester carboxylesterase